MSKLSNLLNKVHYELKGSTFIEMALYIALVVIVCIAVITTLGGRLQSVFQAIVDSL
jgi:Flp pilus assembly pilin Flp